jgi:RpiR family transcriptional regulator, carbohydrate utilization regulator
LEFTDSALENIRSNIGTVFSAEKRVAEFILKNPEQVVALNVSDIAEQSGVSDATVIRLCKHLGYTGYYQMKLQLAHELGRNQLLRSSGQDKKPECADDLLKEIATNILNIGTSVDMQMLTTCVDKIRSAGAVYFVASGNSVPIAGSMAFRLGRIGIRAISASMSEQMIININNGLKDDVVIGISHSGSSKHVVNAFELARKKGITTIVLTDSKRSSAEQGADYTLSTGIKDSSVFIFGAPSYLYLYALTDLLVFFVENARQGSEDEMVEYVLSDTKV